MDELRSPKQQREQLVRSLRAKGKSRVEVTEVLRQRYRFNARVALRYAHEWSQRQASDEWNKRCPDEPKTFKVFSYWEQWPSRTGHAPTFDNLGKLAELYECAVSDLPVDLPDFRHLNTPGGPHLPAALPVERRLDSKPDVSVEPERDKRSELTLPFSPREEYRLAEQLREIEFTDTSAQ